MLRLEEAAGAGDRDRAIRAERELWLPRLERWLADADGPERAFLGIEVRRLRRCLGIATDPETVRAQTRERASGASAPGRRRLAEEFLEESYPGRPLPADAAGELPWRFPSAFPWEAGGVESPVKIEVNRRRRRFSALLVWQSGTYFWRNRPGHYRPDALPTELVPNG
jgi:hypothetical protein